MTVAESSTQVGGIAVPTGHFIGGRRVQSTQTFSVYSPIDGAHLAEVAAGGPEEVDEAAAAARAAFPQRNYGGLEALEESGADTFVIFDTHWFTTTEHVVDGRQQHTGIYTSEELPNAIKDHAFDYPGAPELGRAIEELARERMIPAVNATNEHIGHHYPTLNVLHYVHRGGEKVLSVGVCQTATPDDFLEFGEVIGQAIRHSTAKAALIGSGGMSHKFWPLKQLREHGGYDPDNVVSEEARDTDRKILELWAEGDHERVIDMYPEYRKLSPEGFFGHYLMMAGALGGRGWAGKGRLMSDYENAVGTGQAHVWFETTPDRVAVEA